jgi:heptosyltransferase-3
MSALARAGYELGYLRDLRREGYELAINLTEGDRGAFLAWLSGARDTLGFRPRKGLAARLKAFRAVGDEHLPTHTVNKDLQFLALLGKAPVHKRVEMCWGAGDREVVEKLLARHGLGRFALVHPVARWLFKCWNEARFARVIDHIQQRLGVPVVVTAGPAAQELARVRDLLVHCRSGPLDLSGRLSLPQLACLSARASLFLGVDTAPMHMAAAVGTPVIALFGHSKALAWGPWDNDLDRDYEPVPRGVQRHGRHTLIQHEYGQILYQEGRKLSSGMLRIREQEVIAEVEARLG